MRVLLDTNVLISYLLQIGSPNPPSVIVRAAITGKFESIVLQETIDELRDKVASKPFLSQNISTELVEGFVSLFIKGGEPLQASDHPIPRLTRDQGDDFMLTTAILDLVDYLVTGDKDLLVLNPYRGVQIVTPAAFAAMLDANTDRA